MNSASKKFPGVSYELFGRNAFTDSLSWLPSPLRVKEEEEAVEVVE